MINAYRKGKRKEYAIKAKAEADGKYCMRSSGSHGVFDLIVIDPILQKIELIQVKAGNSFKHWQKMKILRETAQFVGKIDVTVEVMDDLDS